MNGRRRYSCGLTEQQGWIVIALLGLIIVFGLTGWELPESAFEEHEPDPWDWDPTERALTGAIALCILLCSWSVWLLFTERWTLEEKGRALVEPFVSMLVSIPLWATVWKLGVWREDSPWMTGTVTIAALVYAVMILVVEAQEIPDHLKMKRAARLAQTPDGGAP